MKIAIIGTKGIPNHYGGFEQFAEYLSLGLVNRGHEVTVYNPSFHKYAEKIFHGVEICKIYSPEKYIGASANFIYDFLSMRHALKQNFDILFHAGYHTNAPSFYLMKKNSPVLVTNMDGLEWKRSKWGKRTQKLIKLMERIAVAKSDYLVSDNIGIQQYYKREFGVDSFFIPYGADLVSSFDPKYLERYDVTPYKYFVLIARLEPENNIETILEGYEMSGSENPFLVIGNKETKYGRFLQKKFPKVRFLGGIYEKEVLDNLRYSSSLYFHGHSVGGTNPSLLEAMASQCLIVAHENEFNRSVLGAEAFYFINKESVADFILKDNTQFRNRFVRSNSDKITHQYSWDRIVSQYETLFCELILNKSLDPQKR